IKGAVLQEFMVARDSLIKVLNGVDYRTHDQIYQKGEGFEKVNTAP
ncbi:MAG: hypothetical protein JNJ57_20250, partial [Saprospiraceae bacterium]|nr:hypothetical protein [Saprospiraceae bacterium]